MTESNISALRKFTFAVRGDNIDLGQTAFLIAMAEYPHLDIKEEMRVLDSLAAAASRRFSRDNDPLYQANALSEYLFDEVGFGGNSQEYYDPRNCFLNDVISRRLGIPITLSLVYMEVGKRLGIAFEGIGMPGHFLVRNKVGRERLLIDPFHRGILLTEQECAQRLRDIAGESVPWDKRYLNPVTDRELVSRILRNLISIYQMRQDRPRAVKFNKWLLTLESQAPLGYVASDLHRGQCT